MIWSDFFIRPAYLYNNLNSQGILTGTSVLQNGRRKSKRHNQISLIFYFPESVKITFIDCYKKSDDLR